MQTPYKAAFKLFADALKDFRKSKKNLKDRKKILLMLINRFGVNQPIDNQGNTPIFHGSQLPNNPETSLIMRAIEASASFSQSICLKIFNITVRSTRPHCVHLFSRNAKE